MRDDKLCLCVKIVEAAPVSGQSASIGDDAAFWLHVNDVVSAETMADRLSARKSLSTYIDSRPRSEDSRAAEETRAAIAADSQYVSGVKAGWNFRDADDEAGFQKCINDRMAGIHECRQDLASTTPQKADNA